MTAWLDYLARNESGAQGYYAKNPLSSAAGKYQMTGPFLQGLAKKYAPQYVGANLKNQHLNDPKLQEMFMGFAEKDYEASANAAGLPYDDRTKSMFHRLGAPDAMKVFSANPNMPVDQLLGPEIMRVNPDLRGLSAGQLVDAQGYPRNTSGSSYRKSTPPMQAAMAPEQMEPMMLGPNSQDTQPHIPQTPAERGGGYDWGSALIGAGAGLSSIDNPSGAAVAASLLRERRGEGLTAYEAARLAQNQQRIDQESSLEDSKPDKYTTEAQKAAVKRYMDLETENEASQMQLGQLEELEKSLSTEGIYTGPAGEEVTWLKAVGGVLTPDNEELVKSADTAQAAKAIQNQMALGLRSPKGIFGGLTGNTSDRDVKFLLAGVAGLGQTPGANKKIIAAMRRIYERRLKYNAAAARFIEQNNTTNGLITHMGKWNKDQGDMFADINTDAITTPSDVVIDYRDL